MGGLDIGSVAAAWLGNFAFRRIWARRAFLACLASFFRHLILFTTAATWARAHAMLQAVKL
jgi:hypothetical protein